MAPCRLLYYITDRRAFSGDESARRKALLIKIAQAARAGVDYIQLREKDLTTGELEKLARDVVQAVRENAPPGTGSRQPTTALLINSRTDVALAVEADGVHLRSEDISPSEVRMAWTTSAPMPLIGVSCHTPADVALAAEQAATFAVFAPVFEKKDAPGTTPAGLAALQEACRASIPVLALGGITLENAQSCLEAGAAGIAGIRLFQENDIGAVVKRLRLLNSGSGSVCLSS